MTNIDLLRATGVFSKLSDAELEAVARCVVERDVPEGACLIREGQPGESLYIIRSGRVMVEKTVGDKTMTLAELGEGAVFGEMSLIDNFPTSASVTTLVPCSLLLIGRLDLNVLLTWDTVLGAKMWRSFTEMLCRRLRASNEDMLARYGDRAPKDVIGGSW